MPYEYEQDQDVEGCMMVLVIFVVGALLLLVTGIILSWIAGLLGG